MPSPLDQTETLIEDYQSVFRRRVNKARGEIDAAFEKLKRAERADPSKWFGLLREAQIAYRRAFDRSEDWADTKAFVRRVEQKQVNAANKAKPDLAPDATGFNVQQRRRILQDQLDAMRALINDYFDRLRDEAEPEEKTGLLPIAALGGAVAAAHGIFQRRAEFYGRDQAGAVYNEATTTVANQTKARRYEWLRTISANPRDRHLARVGEIFEFGEVSDEPGDLPNCKCGARLVWEDGQRGRQTIRR